MSNQNTSSRFGRIVEGFVGMLGPAFAIIIALAVVGVVGYPVTRSIMSDGHIDYCYVTTSTYQVPNQPNVTVYYLNGFRSWCANRMISPNLPSLEAAKAEADRINCPIK